MKLGTSSWEITIDPQRLQYNTRNDLSEDKTGRDENKSIKARNKALLSSLRVDKHQSWLFDDLKKDVAKGRISRPKLVSKVATSKNLITRRFSREQGFKADGSLKLRAVDDMTACGVNYACRPQEKLRLEGLDHLVQVAKYRYRSCVRKLRMQLRRLVLLLRTRV